MKTLKVKFSDLPKGKTPILTYCRKLIKDGVDPDTRLEIYRNHEYWDIAVKRIEDGAKLSVLEGVRGPPRFVNFKSWDSGSLKKKINKLEGDVL